MHFPTASTSLTIAALLSTTLAAGAASHENGLQRRSSHLDSGLPLDDTRMAKKLKRSPDGGLLGGLLGGDDDSSSATTTAGGGKSKETTDSSSGGGGLLGGLLGGGDDSSSQTNNSHGGQQSSSDDGLLGGLLGSGGDDSGSSSGGQQQGGNGNGGGDGGGGLLSSVVSGLLGGGDGGAVSSDHASSIASELSKSGSNAIGAPTGRVSAQSSSLIFNPSITPGGTVDVSAGRSTSTQIVTATSGPDGQLNQSGASTGFAKVTVALVTVIGGAVLGAGMLL